jgi:TolB protein
MRRLWQLCLSVMLALTASCSDENPVAPPTETGEIRVSVVTAGNDLDVDGYTIVVDGVPGASISVNDSRVLSALPVGRHTVELIGLAANCAAEPALHEITLTLYRSAVIAFAVSCGPWPARSSLNGRIAFVSTRDGSPHIYVATTGSLTRLTRGEAPAWSSDGGRIAFHRNGVVAVIDADGSNLRVLHNGGANPAWSPDGSKIVFNSLCCEGSIFVMNADGSGVVRLIGNDHFAQGEHLQWPTWSPDGRSIAFVRTPNSWDDISQLYVMNADGSEPHHLFISAGVEGWESTVRSHGSWSPDGARLLLLSYRMDLVAWAITSVDVNGAGFQSYASVPLGSYLGNPNWSPNGRSIVFDHFTTPLPVPPPTRIFVVDTAGGEARQLIPDAVRPMQPDYQDYEPAWSHL